LGEACRGAELFTDGDELFGFFHLEEAKI